MALRSYGGVEAGVLWRVGESSGAFLQGFRGFANLQNRYFTALTACRKRETKADDSAQSQAMTAEQEPGEGAG